MTLQLYCLVCLLLVTGLIAVQGQVTSSITCPEVSKCLDGIELRIKVNEQVKASIKSQAEISKLSLLDFHASSVYSGRRYYLRKVVSGAYDQLFGEDACKSIGGNLAEIDDLAEMQFVQSFLSSYQYLIVFIAGTDEKEENKWTNPFKNTPLKYIQFGWGVPNGGTAENCLSLWKPHNYLMNDATCPWLADGTSFLCEVLLK